MANTDVWTYRNTVDSSRDVVGYDVEASDGGIGKIDEASTDAGRYLVVDTGFWIFGKKRLIPAGVVNRVDHDDRKVYVSMTKGQIKDAPDHADMGADRGDKFDDKRYERHTSYYRNFGDR